MPLPKLRVVASAPPDTVIDKTLSIVPLKLIVPVVPANAGEFAIREAVAAKSEAKRMQLNLFIITDDVSDV